MSDDLDLRGIDQRHEPDPEFRAALRRRVLDIAAGIDPSESTDPLDFTTLDIEPVSRRARPTRRRPLIRAVLAVAAAAAVVVAIGVVNSRDNGTNPNDTPMSVVSSNPLVEPSPDEVALASDAATYMVGSGHTEVTPARNYVSLRRCDPQVTDQPAGGCDGTQGWAYVTGGADSPEVHYGLLGIADYLTLSALDDRLFVASTPSSNSLRQSGPAAWLIDSVTGQRGPLKWAEQPVTLNSPEQALVLFPAHHPNPYYFPYNDFFEPFLPRVVDTRDWTIKPLSVPEDAAALPIAQPGSGRIWIGTAPAPYDRLGLAYTDDGGASWTDVELPQTLNTDEEFFVAATGDHLAVTIGWDERNENRDHLFVSADAGDNWTTVPIALSTQEEWPGLNEVEPFVLEDHRLMLVLGLDWAAKRLLVSNTASDWAQLETSTYTPASGDVDVNQHGIVMNYATDMDPPAMFSTDLSDWWTIPGLLPVG